MVGLSLTSSAGDTSCTPIRLVGRWPGFGPRFAYSQDALVITEGQGETSWDGNFLDPNRAIE